MLRQMVCVALALLVSACASKPTFLIEPSAGDNQVPISSLGQTFIGSKQAYSVVLGLESSVLHPGENIIVLGSIMNTAASELQASDIDLLALDQRGRELEVFSRDEILADLTKRHKRQRFALALQAAGNAMSGGSSSGNFNGTVNGEQVSGNVQYQDRGAMQQEAERIRVAQDSEQTSYESTVQRIANGYLTALDIEPNGYREGEVWISRGEDEASLTSITLVLMVGKDVHEFLFRLKPLDG